jgi:hypothetical protein
LILLVQLCSYEEWKKKTKNVIQTDGEEGNTSSSVDRITLGEWRKPRYRYNNLDDAEGGGGVGGGGGGGGADEQSAGFDQDFVPQLSKATKRAKSELKRPEQIQKARKLKEKNKIKQMSSEERKKVFAKKNAEFKKRNDGKINKHRAPGKSRVLVV